MKDITPQEAQTMNNAPYTIIADTREQMLECIACLAEAE